MYTDFMSKIPEGTSGAWSVKRFTIKDDFSLSIFNMKSPGRAVYAGEYTKLCKVGVRGPAMTDTPAEIADLRPLLRAAKGDILINGLGLGIAVELCFDKDSVKHIAVVEISEDVIKLVGPYLEDVYGDQLEIIHADAFEYKPPKGVRYDAVWHDIWNTICADNLPGMHKLHRKYGHRTDWQGSWCRDECEWAR